MTTLTERAADVVPINAAVLAAAADLIGSIGEREDRAYRRGFEAGYRAADDDWYMSLAPAREAARRAARHPSYAELEGRRWGPGGREHFADPKPGDYPGLGR
jgi:hypothetical protein